MWEAYEEPSQEIIDNFDEYVVIYKWFDSSKVKQSFHYNPQPKNVYNICNMNKTTAKKYLSAIKNAKKKCLTSEQLSRLIGKYPDVINKDLSEFEPMLAMDPYYNLKDLIPAMEKYIEELESSQVKKVRFEAKKRSSKYKGVSDFVYQRMTVGGLVDKNKQLSEAELKVLRKLVSEELEALKGK